MAVDNVPTGTGSTSTLAPGGFIAGTIDAAADQDWYRITLTAGRQYRFDLQGSDSGQGTLQDPLLRLVDASGSVVAQNDDSGGSLESSITFSPVQSGTYFLSAQGFPSSTGTFRLSATDITVDANDVPDDTATNSSVSVGGQITGTIDSVGDQDWYRLTLESGRQYRFDLHGLTSGQGTLNDPQLRLLDSGGIEIAANDDSGGTLDSSIGFVAQRSGTYFLSAQGFETDIGTFTLRVTDLTSSGSGDVLATTATTSSIVVGDSASGEVDVTGDQDWYRVSLEAGRQYRFNLRGASSEQGTLDDPLLHLLDSAGREIARNDDAAGSLDSSIGFLADTQGTYYLSAQAFSVEIGSYVLSADEVGELIADVAANTGSNEVITVGGESLQGVIDTGGDQDWYRVSLVAGHSYRFNLQGAVSGQGSLIDPVLRLLDQAGNELVFNDDAGDSLESSIAYTATRSGVHYLSAQGFASNSGSFSLSVSELTDGAGDVPASIRTPSGVAVGGAIPGTIDFSGDQDWYQVRLQAGIEYLFELSANDSALGSLEDPLLRLLDSSGSEITRDDDSAGELESGILFTPSSSGTHYLSAQAFSSGTGTYTLIASENTDEPADVPGDTGSEISLSIGGLVTGVIGTDGDRDWYPVELLAGRSYIFDLAGFDSGRGTLADPFLGLFDDSDVEVAFDDDSGSGLDSRLTFTATESGTYYLSAEGFEGDSSGSFLLSTADTLVDVPSGQGSLSAVLIGDTLEGNIDFVGDQDWYRVNFVGGHQYVFELQGEASGQGTLDDPFLRLLDSSGEEIVFDDDSGAEYESRITFRPIDSGTYYVSAEGFGASVGSYALTAFDLDDVGDTPDSIDSGRSIAIGGFVSEVIGETGDEDWYEVVLISGRQYQFDQVGADSGFGSLGDPLLRLLDDAGEELAVNDDRGDGSLDSSLIFSADRSGRYYLAASAFEEGNGTYVLAVSDLSNGSDDILANSGTTGVVAVNGSVFNSLEVEGDEDWFRVTLQAGREYRIGLSGLDSGAGTLDDPFLVLYDADGFEIADDDDSGIELESEIRFTPSLSGEYFVSVQEFDFGAGTYVLSVQDGLRDVAASIGSTDRLAAGGSVSGTIDSPGDEDWYRVPLLAGHDYRIDLQGADSGLGTLDDPLLRVLDIFGDELLFDDDSGEGAEASLTVSVFESGIYFVAAQAFSSETGTFTLSATDLSVDVEDVPASTGTDSALSVGGAVSGIIDASGDEDWYLIRLSAGQQYRFDLDGGESDLGSLDDPVLRLLDNSGIEIAFNDDRDDGLNSSLIFTADRTGSYYLSAQGFGPSTGAYTLTAGTPGSDRDIPADLQTDATVVIGNVVSGEIDTEGDQDWYRVSLQSGHEYRFDLQAFDSGLGTLDDPFLRLLNDDGQQVAVDDDSGFGLESSIDFTVAEDGDYFLAVQGFEQDTGTFALSAIDLTRGTIDERTLRGSSAADQIIGSQFNDTLQGLDGDDVLDAKEGNDLVDGGPGNDTLSGGLGNDTVFGGDGDDLFLRAEGVAGGDDALAGGAGNDVFFDPFGNNVLQGGDGDDTFAVLIEDTQSTNVVSGGAGRDQYLVQPRQVALTDLAYVITDFEIGIGGDLIDVSPLLEASAQARSFDDDVYRLVISSAFISRARIRCCSGTAMGCRWGIRPGSRC